MQEDLSRRAARIFKFVRLAYGWTKEETEERAGLSAGHATRIENGGKGGRGNLISWDVVVAMAKALKIRDLNYIAWGKIRHRDLLPECITHASPAVLSPRDEQGFEAELISEPRSRRRKKLPQSGPAKKPPKKSAKRGAGARSR